MIRSWRRRSRGAKAGEKVRDAWIKNGLALNARLRGDRVLASEVPLEGPFGADELAQELDSTMAPTRRPRKLLRGVADPESSLGLKGNLEGQEFTDPGFVSTTTDEEMAELFGSGVTLQIDVPPGTPVLDLEELNSQREVLLGRGLRYRVTGDREENGRRVLDVEVLKQQQQRSRVVPWLIGGVAVAVVVVVAVVAAFMAVIGSGVPCVGGGGSAVAAPPTRAAVKEIPPERLRIYQEAGKRFDVDWTFLASLGFQECGHGTCAEVNSSGCGGPMQIGMVRESACSPGSGPTIWERYRFDADGGGADPFSPADAIFTAARMLRPVFGLKGDSYAAYRAVACNYYGACSDGVANYADEVMARAVEYGFRGKGSPSPTSPIASGATSTTGGSSSGCGSGSTSSGSGNEIVRIARSQLGTGESPPGSNCNPYGPCVEWCSLFVSWVWKRAGVPMEGSTADYAYSGSIYTWAETHQDDPFAVPPLGGTSSSSQGSGGARVLPPTATPAPGDAVLYGTGPGFGPGEYSAHVGLVERVFPGGQITTIDGNFGSIVARSGPFMPSQASTYGMPGPVYGYAHPPTSAEGSEDDG